MIRSCQNIVEKLSSGSANFVIQAFREDYNLQGILYILLEVVKCVRGSGWRPVLKKNLLSN